MILACDGYMWFMFMVYDDFMRFMILIYDGLVWANMMWYVYSWWFDQTISLTCCDIK